MAGWLLSASTSLSSSFFSCCARSTFAHFISAPFSGGCSSKSSRQIAHVQLESELTKLSKSHIHSSVRTDNIFEVLLALVLAPCNDHINLANTPPFLCPRLRAREHRNVSVMWECYCGCTSRSLWTVSDCETKRNESDSTRSGIPCVWVVCKGWRVGPICTRPFWEPHLRPIWWNEMFIYTNFH